MKNHIRIFDDGQCKEIDLPLDRKHPTVDRVFNTINDYIYNTACNPTTLVISLEEYKKLFTDIYWITNQETLPEKFLGIKIAIVLNFNDGIAACGNVDTDFSYLLAREENNK